MMILSLPCGIWMLEFWHSGSTRHRGHFYNSECFDSPYGEPVHVALCWQCRMDGVHPHTVWILCHFARTGCIQHRPLLAWWRGPWRCPSWFPAALWWELHPPSHNIVEWPHPIYRAQLLKPLDLLEVTWMTTVFFVIDYPVNSWKSEEAKLRLHLGDQIITGRHSEAVG